MTWMDSCKRVAELLSQRLDEPLSLVEEMKLRLHLSMCRNCQNVDEQLKGLRTASAGLFSGELDLDAMPAEDTPGGAPATPGGSNGAA
ncbi:MAG: zf-HC2 domain-containing protein [Rubrivivax sp.]|nr:zf-HC2 domain-containing protein [Rubrivivax sp.]